MISRVRNREQLNTLIEEMVAIEGVNETSSRFVIQEFDRYERGGKLIGRDGRNGA